MALSVREQVAYENWGWMAVRGIVAILLGLTALIWPGPSLLVLVILFGTFLLVDGITALVYAASGGKTTQGNVWPLVMAGIAGVGGAVITYVWPEITAYILMLIIAFWAIARGVLEIVAFVELRKTFDSSWLLAVSGGLALAFGIVLLVWPAMAARTLVWVIGLYAIVAGGVFMVLSMRMRRALHGGERAMTPPSEPTPA